jgi:hypothetical protein
MPIGWLSRHQQRRARASARDRATALDGQHAGPVEGPVTDRDHLADPVLAYFIVRKLFEPASIVLSDDVPGRVPPPNPMS